jgi:hypothetical protein
LPATRQRAFLTADRAHRRRGPIKSTSISARHGFTRSSVHEPVPGSSSDDVGLWLVSLVRPAPLPRRD